MRKLIVAAVLLGTTPAWALDGYQDRRGLFAGLGVGGGYVASEAPGSEGEVGQRVNVRVGGGVAENLTLDLAFDYLAIPDVDARTISFWGGGSSYFVPMAFARLAVGFANFTADQAGQVDDLEKAGLGVFAGAGFEMFINSDLAAGFTLGYERQQFSDEQSLNIVTGVIGINWY